MPENDHQPDDGAGQHPDDEPVDDSLAPLENADEHTEAETVEVAGEEQHSAAEESDDPLTGAVPDEREIPAPLLDGDDLVPGEAVQQLVPELEKTGHDAVDVALATLDDLASTSVHEHVAVFEATHEELRRALNDAAGTPQQPPSA